MLLCMSWIRTMAFAALTAGCTQKVIVQEVGGGANVPRVAESEVLGDGTLRSVDMVVLYDAEAPLSATDLDFNPARPGELWVVLRKPPSDAPCNKPLPGVTADPACNAYRGSTAILSDATGPHPDAVLEQDTNAWHFMRLPAGIAFGEGDRFATCGESRTANWDDELADFTGPVLWSSAPGVYGVEGPGGNGSHIDMLHATPFCMGIAHERDNVYWAFNGQAGALDRYDFHVPHVPGGEDHSDGEAWRWALGEVTRVPGVPSHLAVDAAKKYLYAVDTGGARVLRVDLGTGTNGGTMPTHDAQLPTVTLVDGAAIEELVPAGTLERPSGIALNRGSMLVTDNATSRIHMFDMNGAELRSLDTGLPPGTLAGIALGPDGKIYFVDLESGVVRRIDPLSRQDADGGD